MTNFYVRFLNQLDFTKKKGSTFMKTCLSGLSFHKSPLSPVNMPFMQTSTSMVVLMLLLSTSLLSGCGGISDIINPGSNNPDVLTVSPLSKTVSLGGSLELNASGGSEPYNFDLYYGNGTVTAAGTTGTYQAPTAEGTAVVRVQDSNGHAGYATIEITDDPVIQPASKTLALSNKFPFSALIEWQSSLYLFNSFR